MEVDPEETDWQLFGRMRKEQRVAAEIEAAADRRAENRFFEKADRLKWQKNFDNTIEEISDLFNSDGPPPPPKPKPITGDVVVKDRWGKETKSEVKLPPIIDARDYLDENLPKPNPDLIHGIVRFGAKLFLGAPSKGRKSWTLLNLAVAISQGLPFWGRQTTRTKVLYINLEIGDAAFMGRVQKVKDEMKVDIDGNLKIWNCRGHAMPLEMFIPLLIKSAKRDFGCIIIDPVYKCLGSRNENDAGDMTSFCNELERLACATGAAIVSACHYAKGNSANKEAMDRISGSGVLARDPDAMLLMTPHETEDCFTVSSVLRDHAPIPEFCVRWQYPLMVLEEAQNPRMLKGRDGQAAPVGEKDILAALPPYGSGKRVTKDHILASVKLSTDAGKVRIEGAFKDALLKGLIEESHQNRRGTNPLKLYALSLSGSQLRPKLVDGPEPIDVVDRAHVPTDDLAI